jgi:hypothetical protein
MPPTMPTFTTRIDLPSAMRAKTGGAFAVAKRGTDHVVRLAVATEREVALADVKGGTVTASLIPGGISPRGHGAFFRRESDQLHLVSPEGMEVALPSSLLEPEKESLASWTLVSQGAVVLVGGWPALHFVKDGAIVWSVGTGAERAPNVAGYAVSSDQNTVYVSLIAADRRSGAVMAMARDGKQLWRKELPVGTGRVVASRGGSAEIAVVTTAPARCDGCMDATIFDAATGEIRRSIALDTQAGPSSLKDDSSDMIESSGFTNGLLWFHAWRREQTDHMLGGTLEERCWYAVYDTNRRDKPLVRINTLPCVRAMIPLDDGGVVTVEMTGDQSITARVYDTVP